MCFFRNLQWIDWLHHILMVVIGAPMLITGEVGPLMNFNHFFMCGVPGGVDYAMLFAVKHGWMQPCAAPPGLTPTRERERARFAAANEQHARPPGVAPSATGLAAPHTRPRISSV